MNPVFLIVAIILLIIAGVCLVLQKVSFLLIGSILAPFVFCATFVDPGFGLYVLVFSMLLSPEISLGATQGNALGRGVTVRIEDFLLIVIGASWFLKSAVSKQLSLLRQTPVNKPIVFYCLACLVATAFGIVAGRVNPKTGMLFILKYIEYFVVFFMVVNITREEQQLKRYLVCLFLTCLIVAIVGILQIPTGERVSAPFEGEEGEPNTMGGYLAFFMSLSLGMLYHIREGKIRFLLAGLIAISLPPFLYTQSRASYLAFVAMVIVLTMMMENRKIILHLLILFVLASPVILPDTIKERVLFTFNQPEESGQAQIGDLRIDTSTSARLESWVAVFRDWPKKPIFGYGVTGYRFIDAQFPKVLAETGIVGFFAFCLLLLTVFNMAAVHYRLATAPYAKGLCMGYIAGLIGLIVHSVGANTFIIVRIMEPFWFVTGLVFVLPGIELAGRVPIAEAPFKPHWRSRRKTKTFRRRPL